MFFKNHITFSICYMGFKKQYLLLIFIIVQFFRLKAGAAPPIHRCCIFLRPFVWSAGILIIILSDEL